MEVRMNASDHRRMAELIEQIEESGYLVEDGSMEWESESQSSNPFQVMMGKTEHKTEAGDERLMFYLKVSRDDGRAKE